MAWVKTAQPVDAAPVDKRTVPILVVDDNAAKLVAVQAVLAPLGYDVVTADSGLAALRCVAAQEFAVILLDIRMPVMDGFETAALIRMRRESEMTPIIFNTSHSIDEIVTIDRYAQGAVDFITAPMQPDELRAKVVAFANLFLKAESLAARARDVEASQNQLRVLTDVAPIGIFQTDAQNRYIYTNPRWSAITGRTADEALGQPWDVILDEKQRALFGQAMAEELHGQEEVGHRFDLLRPGATPLVVHLNSRAMTRKNGDISGWVGTLADVTAEAGAEESLSNARDAAAEASRLKSDFLANMSHEIRTPMNGVLGMTDLLLETDLDVRQRDYAQTVRTSGDALLTVINDILDFSKIETGKLQIENVRFNPRTIIDDVVALLAASAHGNGLALTSEVDDSVPATVGGDPGRLRQVLTNLVGNAIKFTHSGNVTIRAKAATSGASRSLLRIEVSDTGTGIDSDKLQTIFEPFVQGDTSTSRKYGGTGLGLAITSQLVDLMGGEVGVTSQPGKGSTFWFTLGVDTHPKGAAGGAYPGVTPLLPRGGPPPERSPAPAAPVDVPIAPGPSGPLRLLLAEDNMINQKVAVAMLAGSGHHVDTAQTGAEAVTAASQNEYDAILMDCQMPEMNGYEATAAIRALEGPDRHTPIIALTAGARPEDRERCLAAGMDTYLSKPFNKATLTGVVLRSVQHPSEAG